MQSFSEHGYRQSMTKHARALMQSLKAPTQKDLDRVREEVVKKLDQEFADPAPSAIRGVAAYVSDLANEVFGPRPPMRDGSKLHLAIDRHLDEDIARSKTAEELMAALQARSTEDSPDLIFRVVADVLRYRALDTHRRHSILMRGVWLS